MNRGVDLRNPIPDMRAAVEHTPQAMLVDTLHRLAQAGLHGETSVSARSGGGLLMCASGMLSEPLTPDDVLFIARDGGTKGRHQRTLDWPLHQAIYLGLADVQAVVHVQSPYATALACLERSLPAFHHRVAVAGGDSVPCVPYQTPGSNVLSAAVVEGLSRRHACLIAHDGLVATGDTLAHATRVAVEVEALCRIYMAALAVGEPPRLERPEIARLLDKLNSYARTPWA
jgi:L-fuculose-phosphate aldolase